MQRVRESMASGGIALLAVVFALALATFDLAKALASQVVSVLVQRTIDESGGAPLSVRIRGTEIAYADVLLAAITVALVALALAGVWLLTRRAERTCPDRRSRILATASICRYCTTELGPADTDA